MNIAYPRKIKNRKKMNGGLWLIGAHTLYLSVVTTKQKTRQRHIRHLLMRVKVHRCVKRVLMMGKRVSVIRKAQRRKGMQGAHFSRLSCGM